MTFPNQHTVCTHTPISCSLRHTAELLFQLASLVCLYILHPLFRFQIVKTLIPSTSLLTRCYWKLIDNPSLVHMFLWYLYKVQNKPVLPFSSLLSHMSCEPKVSGLGTVTFVGLPFLYVGNVLFRAHTLGPASVPLVKASLELVFHDAAQHRLFLTLNPTISFNLRPFNSTFIVM